MRIRPCIVKDCFDISSRRHHLPIRNQAMKEIWLDRIANSSLRQYSDKELYNRVFVCGRHFIKECIPGFKLLRNALPSVNLPGFSGEPSLQNSFFLYAETMSSLSTKNSEDEEVSIIENEPEVIELSDSEEVYEANQLCRLCFSSGSIDVFSCRYYKKLLRDIVKTFLPIDIKKEDVSTVVCESCKSEVIRFYNFMLKSLQVDEYFRAISQSGDDKKSFDFIVIKPSVSVHESDSKQKTIELNGKEAPILESLLSDKNKQLGIKKASELQEPEIKLEVEVVNEDIKYDKINSFIKTLHCYAKSSEKLVKLKKSATITLKQDKTLSNFVNDVDADIHVDTIVCIHCNKVIDNIDEFHDHCKFENHDPVFTCKKCNRLFVNQSELIIHSETHERNDKSICDRCGKQFNKRESLQTHINLVHGKRELKFSCEICSKKFTTNYRLKLHLRVHTNDRPYCCEQCGAVFSILANLKNHQLIHSDYKPHVCLICNKGFRRKYKLAVHMTKHTGERKFMCDKCGVAYKRKVNLTRHNRKHHLNAEGEEIQGKLRTCTHCDYECQFSGQLKLHMLKVHKSYTCTLCNMSFKNYQPYYNHKFKHYPNKKRFVCPYCNKRFANTTLLNVHLVVHTGKKNFECQVCQKRFSQKPHLQSHLLTHTGEKPHTCKYCPKSFAHLSTLVVHERIHTGETPYVCDFCNKGFGHLTNYKKHVFSQHGVIMPKKRDYPRPGQFVLDERQELEDIEIMEEVQQVEFINAEESPKYEYFENDIVIAEDVSVVCE